MHSPGDTCQCTHLPMSAQLILMVGTDPIGNAPDGQWVATMSGHPLGKLGCVSCGRVEVATESAAWLTMDTLIGIGVRARWIGLGAMFILLGLLRGWASTGRLFLCLPTSGHLVV